MIPDVGSTNWVATANPEPKVPVWRDAESMAVRCNELKRLSFSDNSSLPFRVSLTTFERRSRRAFRVSSKRDAAVTLPTRL